MTGATVTGQAGRRPVARRIKIDGELTIITAAEQRDRLLAALPDAGSLDLDLSGVADLDTAGLQLLLLARREAVRRDLTIHFRDASPAVIDALAIAHLDEALEPWARDDSSGAAAEPEA